MPKLDDDDDLISLKVAADELGTTTRALKRLAARGQFVDLLPVTQKHFVISRSQYENWKIRRWIRSRGGRDAFVTDVPVRPPQRRRRAASKP